jgi:hypothetical protein
MKTCERCRAELPAESYELMDYCTICGKNLCDKCMQQGCCAQIPALSGTEEDNAEDEDDAPTQQLPSK